MRKTKEIEPLPDQEEVITQNDLAEERLLNLAARQAMEKWQAKRKEIQSKLLRCARVEEGPHCVRVYKHWRYDDPPIVIR